MNKPYLPRRYECFRLTRNSAWLNRMAPVLKASGAWINVERAASNPRSPYAGLLPHCSLGGDIRLVLTGLLGMEFERTGIRFRPWLPEEIESLTLRNLHYRKGVLNICLKGHGNRVKNFIMNGKNQQVPLIPADLTGEGNLDITLSA